MEIFSVDVKLKGHQYQKFYLVLDELVSEPEKVSLVERFKSLLGEPLEYLFVVQVYSRPEGLLGLSCSTLIISKSKICSYTLTMSSYLRLC